MNHNVNTLTVQGTGTVMKKPNRIVLYTTLVQRGITSSDAMKKLEQNYQDFVNIFVRLGYDPNDLLTSSINISLINEAKFEQKSIECTQDITFETDLQLHSISELLAALHTHNNFNLSVAYRYSDEDGARLEAIEMAVMDAKRVAHVISTSSEVTLGSIAHIEYIDASQTPYHIRAMGVNSEYSTIQTRDITFTQTLTITWQLH
ncbi:hypothetical protein AOC36_06990 [Erysipelothrix larvae]|uniref:SIMPL domain-containing protein n=1 Tax=Erysipelothrix larvae TaxID=1514105 RepID=A0A120JTR6_9FIRM|nr:SIMPL domain-containing protein [Erysipelothrix larvae]AMC93737.1 hypothetical protein AOC36_06990 [Erysipelothrix larvae]